MELNKVFYLKNPKCDLSKYDVGFWGEKRINPILIKAQVVCVGDYEIALMCENGHLLLFTEEDFLSHVVTKEEYEREKLQIEENKKIVEESWKHPFLSDKIFDVYRNNIFVEYQKTYQLEYFCNLPVKIIEEDFDTPQLGEVLIYTGFSFGIYKVYVDIAEKLFFASIEI